MASAETPQPGTPPMKDHTGTVLAGIVAIVLVMAALAIGLEATDSDETLSIMGVIGALLLTPTVPVLLTLFKVEQATQGVTELKGTLNGDLDVRIEAAAARAVRTVMQQRDRELDERIRAIAHEVVSTEIDRLVTACDLERRDGDT